MPFLGVNAPLRLLRKAWDTPGELAEELYAMFTAKAPIEHEGPVTLRAPANQTALKIEQVGQPDTFSYGFGGDTHKHAADPGPAPRREPPGSSGIGPSRRPPSIDTEGVRRPKPQDPQRRQPPPPRDFAAGPTERPAVDISAPTRFRGKEPVYFEKPPYVWKDDTFEWTPVTAGEIQPPPPSARSVFLGQVASGAGSSYKVALYSQGIDGPPDGDPVTVTIPTMDESEALDPGTWIAPIFRFSDPTTGDDVYQCQVPIWLTNGKADATGATP